MRRARLLDLDPDLGADLDPHRESLARRHLVVRVVRVDVGHWRPRSDEFAATEEMGLLVAGGLAVRQVSLGHRAAGELLGPGDILQPWLGDGEHGAYPFSATWRVTETLELAVLDPPVMARLAHFPEIITRLTGRVMDRARRVVGCLVIAQLTAVDARLHVALWHMADRFGRVRADGILVPVNLTHAILGLIVGARRPSVTSAIGRLADAGLSSHGPAGAGCSAGTRRRASPGRPTRKRSDAPRRSGHATNACRGERPRLARRR